MNDLTPELNKQSIESVRAQINGKLSSEPYFANSNTVKTSVTDMDHHPYTRWFRGVYYYPDPIVMEREAGWRPINNTCYNNVAPMVKDPEPNWCYEVPRTTTFPCNPKQNPRYAERNMCVISYR
jgi:hypothetical protein